jgi:hypothetical protein
MTPTQQPRPKLYAGLHVLSTEDEDEGIVLYAGSRIVTVEWTDLGWIKEYAPRDFTIGGRYDSVFVERGDIR